MRLAHSIVVVALLAFALPLRAGDLDKLQGKWSVISLDQGGKELPKDKANKMSVTIKGDMLTLDDGKRKEVGTIELDPSKTPKTIDFTPSKAKKERALFIYELSGDDLKLCWRKPGAARPKEFSSKDKAALMVLKRAK